MSAKRNSAMMATETPATDDDLEDFLILSANRGGNRDKEPLPPLSSLKAAHLRLDDGARFIAGFRRDISPSDLSEAIGGWVLRHPPIRLGARMDRARIAGVTLIAEGEQGYVSMRCDFVQPLHAGGGMVAEIGANALLFRDIP